MAPVALKRTRLTILLSLNAVAILIAGIAIASAIWLNGGIEFRVVGERSDIIEGESPEAELLESVSSTDTETAEDFTDYIFAASHEFDDSAVASNELWNESAITIYATPDIDICIGGGLSGIGDTYWQTSNPKVIAGFYDSARSWLGFSSETCRYPVIKGTGTTVITAGTYDGKRKDSITVNVINPPKNQWTHEVLTLVNKVRIKNNLHQLSWSSVCEDAAEVRATETIARYSHTRPDGSDWVTACPPPETGGASGENLAIGNAAVSPATVVSLWMSSEAHRANILSPDYTKLAVGFVFEPESTYRTHWSQFFSTY